MFILILIILAISIISLSFAYQALVYNRVFLSSRGWVRIVVHNTGVNLMVTLSVVMALIEGGDLVKYWYLILFIIVGRWLGDLPLIITKEMNRRELSRRNHDIIRKYIHG